jgi:hypothetical protein
MTTEGVQKQIWGLKFETREVSGDAKPTLQILAASCSGGIVMGHWTLDIGKKRVELGRHWVRLQWGRLEMMGFGGGGWRMEKEENDREGRVARSPNADADIHRGALEEAKCVQHVFLQQYQLWALQGSFMSSHRSKRYVCFVVHLFAFDGCSEEENTCVEEQTRSYRTYSALYST